MGNVNVAGKQDADHLLGSLLLSIRYRQEDFMRTDISNKAMK